MFPSGFPTSRAADRVAERLGIGPADVPGSVVYCSITGFGTDGRHAARVGHDLNYLGWAGVLEDTVPSPPPVQAADLAAGALGAVTQVLAAPSAVLGTDMAALSQ